LKYAKLWELVLKQKGDFRELPDEYPPPKK